MSPATKAKAAAIHAALPRYESLDLAALLAMLTSANKDEREKAKREIRKYVEVGTEILAAQRTAADLASFANRHEP